MFNKISNILLIFSYVFLIGIFLTLIVKYYRNFLEKEYIWFCSKILTVQKIVSDNNNIIKAFYNFNEEGKELVLSKNYIQNLELITKDGCIENFRQCGILDTYGNKLCFPNNDDCPINEIIIDSPSKRNDYKNAGYDSYIYGDSGDNLYYKKGLIDKGIIAYWNASDSLPLYINEKNFIFDIEAFKEIFGSIDEEYNEVYITKQIFDESIDWLGDLTKNAAKLERIHKLLIYINEKIFDDEKNIDKNFTKIYKKEYIKRYLGFENEESIKNFKRIDFSIYKSFFPNYKAVVFSFISIFLFIGLIIINIFSIFYLIKNKEIENLKKYNIIFSNIIYCPTFLGFLIYFTVIYTKIYKSESIEYAKKVRADRFIEDFLNDFIKSFGNNALILCSIIIFSISGVLYIIGWFISPFNKCIKYYTFYNIERKEILQNQNNLFTDKINIDRKTAETFAVIFTYTDQGINYPIAYKNSDIFSKLEEQLYIEYPDLKKKKIYFLANGNIIDRKATIEKNKIKNGTTILIQEIEENEENEENEKNNF